MRPLRIRTRIVAAGTLAAVLASAAVFARAAAAPTLPGSASTSDHKVNLAAGLFGDDDSGDSGGGDDYGSDGGFANPFVPDPGPSAEELAAQEEARREAARRAHEQAIAAHRAELAARRAAKAQAAAARRAAHQAAAEASARATWARVGRPHQLVIVRGRHIDVVADGALRSRLPRPAGPLTLAALSAGLPAGWLAVSSDDTARLNASLVLSAGTVLDNGPEVRLLNLASGADSTSAAGIWVGRATLNLHGLTVNAVDPPPGTPEATAQRGFLVAGSGGTLNIADATLTNLGAAPVAAPHATPAQVPLLGGPGAPAPARPAPAPAATPARAGAPAAPVAPANPLRVEPGLVYGPGSTGSVARSTIKGNGVGLKLVGSHDVRLDTVTVARSRSDGVVLRGDRGTTANAVRSQDNAGNGVVVTGPSTDRLVSGFNTEGNARWGLAVLRQTNPKISKITSTGDHDGGIRLTGTTGAVVSEVTSADNRVGILANGAGGRLRLTGANTTGGLTGIEITSGVTGVEISNSRVAGASGVGVLLGGTNSTVHQLTVRDSAIGLRVGGRANRTTVTDARISGGQTGIRVTPTARTVALNQVSIDGVSGTGISTAGPNTTITGARVAGGITGINARAATRIADSSVGEVNEAVHAAQNAQVTGDRVDLLAVSSGIKVDPAASFVLSDSRVRAYRALRGPVTLRGTNTISLPPFNWIGAFGILFVTLALLLELIYVYRQRHRRRLPRPVPAIDLSRQYGLPDLEPLPDYEPLPDFAPVPALATSAVGGSTSGSAWSAQPQFESAAARDYPTAEAPRPTPHPRPTPRPRPTPYPRPTAEPEPTANAQGDAERVETGSVGTEVTDRVDRPKPTPYRRADQAAQQAQQAEKSAVEGRVDGDDSTSDPARAEQDESGDTQLRAAS